MSCLSVLRFATVFACVSLVGQLLLGESLTAYIGTYTRGDSEGIYRLSLEIDGDEIKSSLDLAVEVENPSFLALHPNGKYLYSVGEMSKLEIKGKRSGVVHAFKIGENGWLFPKNSQPSLGGAPCHLVIDKTGQHVLVANYSGGNVISLPIKDDGGLGPITSNIQHEGSSILPRQKGPHAHSINLDAANRFAFAADLGLDKVLIYRFNEKTGELRPHDPAFVKVKPGSGPRHFAFHPDGDRAYVINEIALTVTAFDYDAEQGELTPTQTISTIPEDITDRKGLSTAEVQVHPSGKFVYGSNRGHDTIAVFALDDAGKLTRVQNQDIHGKTPRNFGIDPSGKYLLALGQSSNTISVFRIDQANGKLSLVGKPLAAPSPVCIKFFSSAATVDDSR